MKFVFHQAEDARLYFGVLYTVFNLLVRFIFQYYQAAAFETDAEIIFSFDDGRYFTSFVYFVFQVGNVVTLSVAETIFVEGIGFINEVG